MNASPDPGPVLLEVRGLSKNFGVLRALQDVDFTLRAGEIHALLGENGAGKSTLIKVVTGVFARDAGIVRLDGVEVWQAGCNGYYRVGGRIVTQWPSSMSEYRARTERPDLDVFEVGAFETA